MIYEFRRFDLIRRNKFIEFFCVCIFFFVHFVLKCFLTSRFRDVCMRSVRKVYRKSFFYTTKGNIRNDYWCMLDKLFDESYRIQIQHELILKLLKTFSSHFTSIFFASLIWTHFPLWVNDKINFPTDKLSRCHTYKQNL